MPRSNNHVDKHTCDIGITSSDGNHAKDIIMNTIVIILAAAFLGALAHVQIPEVNESSSVEDGVETEKNTTLDLNETTLQYIQSLIAKINKAISHSKEAEDENETVEDEKNKTNEDEINKTDEDLGRYNIEEDADDKLKITNDSETVGRNGDRRSYLLESIKRILNGNANYRRLDISAGIDIDDPLINEFQRNDSGFKDNRPYTSYGASIEMKGRSGGIQEDLPVYYSPIPRRLFYNPTGYNGFYQRATTTPITRPITRDQILQLKPINLFNSLPHRRKESQGDEDMTDILDDANSYKYTPENYQ